MSLTKAEFERRVEEGVSARLRQNHEVGQAHRQDERHFGDAARGLRLLVNSMRYDEARQLHYLDRCVWQLDQDCRAVAAITAAFQQRS